MSSTPSSILNVWTFVGLSREYVQLGWFTYTLNASLAIVALSPSIGTVTGPGGYDSNRLKPVTGRSSARLAPKKKSYGGRSPAVS